MSCGHIDGVNLCGEASGRKQKMKGLYDLGFGSVLFKIYVQI